MFSGAVFSSAFVKRTSFSLNNFLFQQKCCPSNIETVPIETPFVITKLLERRSNQRASNGCRAVGICAKGLGASKGIENSPKAFCGKKRGVISGSFCVRFLSFWLLTSICLKQKFFRWWIHLIYFFSSSGARLIAAMFHNRSWNSRTVVWSVYVIQPGLTLIILFASATLQPALVLQAVL